MANTQISELATTKTSGTIDADAEYIAAEPVSGTSYKALITEAVAAGLAQATAALTVADDVSVEGGITLNSLASSVPLQINIDGVRRLGFFQQESSTAYNDSILIAAPSKDFGASAGPRIQIGRNSNASTPSAGHFLLRNLNNSAYRIWPDGSGNLRIGTTDPSYANDTAGTVVGTQTSMAAAKDIMPGLSAIDDVATRIRAGADAVRKFAYKSGAYNRQMFEGVVVDEAPEYGMDRDDDHPAGKSLNEIQIIGDLLRMVADLAQRVAELEAK